MLEHLVVPDAALTVAWSLLAGVVAQSLARHLRLPGIVLLLAAGVLLGPDGLGLVQPATLGPALSMLVSFAVAVVLFEGGLNLDLRRLRREATTIRRLVVLGALLTGLGGAMAARMLMGWPWILSLLFGSLVIVTGPTVITPLLRRIKVVHQ
ncbi:MAG: cation:proton antiporter, partial [Acidobacteria bacterium]|nr:cation:proton antiporter [Acidobacteriota bacterium]